MEKYIGLTEAYLAMIQSTMSKKEKKRSSKATDEIYDGIAEVAEKHNLTIKEMLNATVAIHLSIMTSVEEDLENDKLERAMKYE